MRRSASESRSSRPEVFYKKGALKNFAKLTGKHPCQRLFFNKVAGLRWLLLRKHVPLAKKRFIQNPVKHLKQSS